jgi:hypothetical protein
MAMGISRFYVVNLINHLSDILAKARLELYEHSYSVILKCSCAVLFAITKYYSMHR